MITHAHGTVVSSRPQTSFLLLASIRDMASNPRARRGLFVSARKETPRCSRTHILFFLHCFTRIFLFFVCWGPLAILRVSDVLVGSLGLGGIDPASTSDGCDEVCSSTNKGLVVIERLPAVKRRLARDQTKVCP